jgi:PAP2 superfamily
MRRMTMTVPPLALATVLAAVAPLVARASSPDAEAPLHALELRPPKLEVSKKGAAIVTGTALVLWGAAALQRATDDVTGCRWCEPGQFDRWARDELRWSDTGAAGVASHVGLSLAVAGSAAAVAWQASREGDRREVIEDVFVVLASYAVTSGVTQIVQYATARTRPYAWASGAPTAGRDLRAFFSGHTSGAFAAVAAATQVSRLRGRRGTVWVAAAGFAVAAATGWLRIAADQHWTTDVFAGAAAGTAIGWAVPTFSLRPVARGSAAKILPAPGGIAIVF